MIGYYGHMNGLPDQNINPNGANLATGGAALIKANRAKILDHVRELRARHARGLEDEAAGLVPGGRLHPVHRDVTVAAR